MYPYRIFLSYCSEDRAHAVQLEENLSAVGLSVYWDHKLVGGNPFTSDIKAMISRSHLFVVLLTEASKDRPWIHQETGFAMGVGVPILPIALDETYPDALIRDLQAQRLEPSSMHDARDLLARVIKERVHSRYPYDPENYIHARTPEHRTDCIASFAEKVIDLGGGRVRQRAALTSFHMPDVWPSNRENDPWKMRDGDKERSGHLRGLLYKERHRLGTLAAKDGCTLIMAPDIRLDRYGDEALLIRQAELLSYLRDEQIQDVKPIVLPKPERHNLLIVGDWFYAESRDPSSEGGYKHTYFTWHAPSVLEKIEEFDREFESHREAGGIDPSLLRRTAKDRLEKIVEKTKRRLKARDH